MELKVGISACLVGQEVRYDGGHKRDRFLMERLAPHVDWIPVCPEVEMGLGTPREPIQLVRQGAVRLMTVQTGVDHTAVMSMWAARRLEALAVQDLDGYVLKSASPSCGLNASIFAADRQVERGPGLFAAGLLARFPLLPVEEEATLHDDATCSAFLERVRGYHASKILRVGSRA